MDDKEREVVEKKTKAKRSVERKKKIKKKKREERLAGLILLIVSVFIGFVLWVSGEMREKKNYQSNFSSPIEIDGDSQNDDVLIIR